MCDLPRQQNNMVVLLAERTDTLKVGPSHYDYARLVLATNTPLDNAAAYLKDTGSPEAATGRLLLRAAERALRKSGDMGGSESAQ